MTAGEPRKGHPTSGPQAEPVERLVGIVRAGRQVAAMEADERGERIAIDLHQPAAGKARDARNPSPCRHPGGLAGELKHSDLRGRIVMVASASQARVLAIGYVLRLRWGSSARLTSVPIPKFANTGGTLSCELRNQRDTGNSMLLVPLLNPKFAIALAARLCELRVRGTEMATVRRRFKRPGNVPAFGYPAKDRRLGAGGRRRAAGHSLGLRWLMKA